MLIAREGEEIVCPKGTVCGRMMRDANDQIIDGDFAAREASSSSAAQRYLCACCGRTVAVREPVRLRVHLRRRYRNRQGYTLRSGFGCPTFGVHQASRSA